MKLFANFYLLPFFFTVCISLQITSCAGKDTTEDPVQPSENANEENNSGNDENNSGNNESNAEGNGNAPAAAAAEANADGGLNNAKDENFAAGGDQGNLFGNGNNNNLLNNKNGGNPKSPAAGANDLQTDDALVNNAETEDLLATQQGPELNQGATDLGPVPAERSVPNSAPAAAATGGVVRYVVAGGSSLHDKPSGSVVKSLEQGDHPLVSESGEWARTSDGFYVPSHQLSAQPIGRAKAARSWR